MVNYNFLKKLMVVGERHVLEEIITYIEKAKLAEENLKEAMTGSPEKIKLANIAIRDLEKEGDVMTMNLKHEITNGAISSTLMSNLSELIEKCDTLLDTSYFISREIKRMNNALENYPDTEKQLILKSYSVFVKMLDADSLALDSLKGMLLSRDIQEMKKFRLAIETDEEKVDEYKDDLIDDLYRKSTSLSYLSFSHLTNVVHKVDDLLDDCEDISDIVLTIVTSLTK
ncbi:MAG: DUF47 family protein [Candidatus Thermoplasmatota archaeon]|jgi:uncharacterized protein Yka (UPF0111/DUF47 family)|nr:DUF47 family protein [Candidatus Thermoplasmatota archaeon]